MRDATVRIVLSVLAVILLAAQFQGTAAPTASAHGAEAPSRATPAAHTLDLRDHDATRTGLEYAPCGLPNDDGDPNGSLRTRDRHRASAQSVLEPLSRCLVTGDTADRPPAEASLTPARTHLGPRSSAVHSPAVLQVFRC
ncbi:hypothetical protein ABT001_26560 [Streptomyces sp. NPDC002793]|uniref:hypothetical protein n=1 Tax=Streptomyces sp. NPDC002793 TaxID=3154432 RepID=UPI0033247192